MTQVRRYKKISNNWFRVILLFLLAVLLLSAFIFARYNDQSSTSHYEASGQSTANDQASPIQANIENEPQPSLNKVEEPAGAAAPSDNTVSDQPAANSNTASPRQTPAHPRSKNADKPKQQARAKSSSSFCLGGFCF